MLSILRSLSFAEDRREILRSIPDGEWPHVFAVTDPTQLTLPLAIRCAAMVPDAVRSRLENNLADNARRHALSIAVHEEIAESFAARGIDYVVLKGLTQWPYYCDDLRNRPQYDIDIYCPRESILAARDCLAALGYEAVEHQAAMLTDHLPAMLRRTGFKWRGDYYDPALPLSVELHYRFWDPETEGFNVEGASAFFERRVVREIEGLSLPALHPADALSYTAWHLVRHLLRGSVRLGHVYELAHFLERTSNLDSFWREGGGQIAECIAFRLAMEWFGCRAHPVVLRQVEQLPPSVDRWFRLFALSPALALEDPNKDELFLHFSLAKSRRARLRIAKRRIFPLNVPLAPLDAHAAPGTRTSTLRRGATHAGFMLRRFAYHLRTLGSVARSALRWWL